MQLLVVDERDGRVAAELESEDEALLLLGRMASGDEIPPYLSILAFQDGNGAAIGMPSSVTVRTL